MENKYKDFLHRDVGSLVIYYRKKYYYETEI